MKAKSKQDLEGWRVSSIKLLKLVGESLFFFSFTLRAHPGGKKNKTVCLDSPVDGKCIRILEVIK